PINPENGQIEGKDIAEQAQLVMENIGALLEAAGTDYTKVVKTTCFLADMGDFAAFNEVYAKYFTEKPARSCVAVKTLPKNVLCEVEVIAEV
ncbi:MAG: regulator, partial [Lachnospiraceae bacterium]|nr:regulator [Lachnospiraceae bacterium]